LTRNGLRRLLLVLTIILPLISFSSARAAQSVLLSWDRIPDPTIIGYYVYYGTESGNYTGIASPGVETSVVIPGIVEGQTYYFAVTAMDMLGQESLFSNEVSYTAPLPPPPLSISFNKNGATLTGAGIAGHVYEIQATTNFVSWTVIGTLPAEVDGSFLFTDSDAANYPARFYRFRDTTP
jgi:hypothetical protein